MVKLLHEHNREQKAGQPDSSQPPVDAVSANALPFGRATIKPTARVFSTTFPHFHSRSQSLQSSHSRCHC